MYLFLSGAEMEPERVRGAWPEARFVARARLSRGRSARSRRRRASAMRPGASSSRPPTRRSPVTRAARSADDGRVFAVTVPPADDADPAAVLAAARYWELPPPYVRRLMSAANAPVEDYVY